MVEVSLEQKIADFHKARMEERVRVERASWKAHARKMSLQFPECPVSKEAAAEIFDRVRTILAHSPSRVSEIDSLLSAGDYSLATAKLAWIEQNTRAGSNGSMVRRRDAHTKFAPHWSGGKLVHRNPTIYMRSVEDMYTALSDIAHKGAKPLQYQITRATAPFSPIFNEAVQLFSANRALAPTSYEHNFGENSQAYRAGIFNQLSEMATTPIVSFVPRPFAGAFSLVERLREQFGEQKARAQVAALAPFILYGVEQPQQTQTSAQESGNVTRYHTYDGRRARTAGVTSAAPKYTPQRMKLATDRPTVQISYSPIFGGSVR